MPQPPPGGIRTQSRNNVLAEAVELLALGNIEAPAYVGASSGLNLALTLGEMVQATVWNKALPLDTDGSRPGTTDGSGISRGARAINRQEMVARSAEPPADEHGTALLNAYLNQPQYVSAGFSSLGKTALSIPTSPFGAQKPTTPYINFNLTFYSTSMESCS